MAKGGTIFDIPSVDDSMVLDIDETAYHIYAKLRITKNKQAYLQTELCSIHES